MSQSSPVAAKAGEPKSPSNRIYSIDVFRGLTIFTMVFVNDVAGVKGIPQWMKHMPADADAMTFVDLVFPAFLFIVGMAIPFAVNNRLKKDPNPWTFWQHTLIRTAGLLTLGFFMVNAEEMNREATLIPAWIWNLLLYISAILIWNQYPRTEDRSRYYLYWALRLAGAAVLIFLAFVYRKGDPGQLTGMTTSWWGILGLIGWAYLYAMIIFMGFGRRFAPVIGMIGLCTIMVVGLKSEGLHFPALLEWVSSEAGNLSHTTLTLAGIALAMLLTLGDYSPRQRILQMLVFGVALFIAGYFLRPLYGISKIYATPTWALYSAAICCLLYPLVYWLVDLKGYRRWAAFLKPAGENPLLTYILPFIYYALAGFSLFPAPFNEGIWGILRSIIFSLLILGLASLLTRWRVRLHL